MYGQLIQECDGKSVPLTRASITIGRSPDCDLVIACRSVSSQHCKLEFIDGYWNVTDLNSRNGTGIDGKRCTSSRILPGQLLQVAKHRFLINYLKARNRSSREAARARGVERLIQRLAGNVSADQNKSQTVPSNRSTQSLSFDSGTVLIPQNGCPSISIESDDVILGRSSECDVRIDSFAVSLRHCRLFRKDGFWIVEDLKSGSGTFVQGSRFRRKCVPPGAILGLASEKFVLQYDPGDGVSPRIHEPYDEPVTQPDTISQDSLMNEFA